ncbi:hypothetical protein GCM10009817_05900 [Terrabacter lapilli]|uniref:Uncharacterized protein n=1 Tax=Terrabacter lapilli TaxID=436231 RepID=A0ABN2RGI8_9MICO
MTKDECEHYVDDVGGKVLGMSQAYAPAMKPGHGCEVFSLFRRSGLLPGEYLDRQFDNGREHQSSQSD